MHNVHILLLTNRGTLRIQSNSAIWGQEVQELLQQGISSPRRGVDVGDHPPITPMRPASESEVGHDAFRLYELITRVFIATVSCYYSCCSRSLVRLCCPATRVQVRMHANSTCRQ